LACSTVTTSITTPLFSIAAKPVLTLNELLTVVAISLASTPYLRLIIDAKSYPGGFVLWPTFAENGIGALSKGGGSRLPGVSWSSGDLAHALPEGVISGAIERLL
jgi:hypothetical protein